MKISRILLAGAALAIAAFSFGQASIGQTDTLNGRSNLVIRFSPTIAGVTYLPSQSFGYDGVLVDANGGPDRFGDPLNTFGTNTDVTWDAVNTFAVNLSTFVDVMPFVWVQGNFDRQVYVQGIGNGAQSNVADIALLTNVPLTITADGADFDFLAPVTADPLPVNSLKLDYLFQILTDSTNRTGGSVGAPVGGSGLISTTAAAAPGTPGTGNFSQLLSSTQTTQGWATLRMTRTLTVSIANGVVPPGTYSSEGTVRFALGL